MTVRSLGLSDSVRSPLLLIVLAGLGAAAHAGDEGNSRTDSACPRAEVLEHVLAQFRLYGPLSEKREYFGFIFRANAGIESSVTRGSVCGANQFCGLKTAPAAAGIPKGAKVLGEWHTHPHVEGSRNLSVEDVRGARINSRIRCYTAFYAASDGRIFAWDPRSSSVPTAMASRSELGNYRDAAPDTVAEVAIPPASR